MIIELPDKKFRMDYAEVINGELLIYENVRFEDLMYELTYACKKRICYYCGKKLTKTTSTIDHGFPRASGGISITNNLYPSCSICNSKKGDLTHDEYLHSVKLDKTERKIYRKQLIKYREDIFRKKGFKLPKRWISYVPLAFITYTPASTDLRGKRYHQIRDFYQRYKKLSRPIVLDKNMNLLDGYNYLLFAKDYKLSEVPAIILENVILF